jgi:hypothetical protein
MLNKRISTSSLIISSSLTMSVQEGNLMYHLNYKRFRWSCEDNHFTGHLTLDYGTINDGKDSVVQDQSVISK